DGVADTNELTPWYYTWKNLPTHRQADGLLYIYYVVETGVPEYYSPDLVDDLTVTNTYTLTSVNVKKFVDGNLGDHNREFTFIVTLGNEVKFPENGTGYTIDPDDPSKARFTLKHGEDATLIVPIGASLTIVETGNVGYVVTVEKDGAPV